VNIEQLHYKYMKQFSVWRTGQLSLAHVDTKTV